MDMNRIAPLHFNPATESLGQVITYPDGTETIRYYKAGTELEGMTAKINQVIAELEKVQQICFALSKVATADPNEKPEGTGDDKPAE